MLNNTPLLLICGIQSEAEVWKQLTTHPQEISLQLPKLFTQVEAAHDLDSTLTIAAVRQLKETVGFALGQDEVRAILISLTGAGTPAQNALLKTLEEPPENTYIVITCADVRSVLPTIQSRCNIQHLAGVTMQTSNSTTHNALATITTGKIPDIIDLCQTHKNRDDARELVQALLVQCSAGKGELPEQIRGSMQALLLAAHTDLAYNVNAQLALEHYFLRIRSLSEAV